MENIRKKKNASNGRKKTTKSPVTEEEIAAYEEMFLSDDRCVSRKSLHINAQYHRRILSLVCATGRSGVTVAGFVNRLLELHFAEKGKVFDAVRDKHYRSLKS
uniref:DUF3408 domain-containing protein n=1 Tax=Bacteroides ovatus TaxID=28116 RepID=UPI00359CA9BD